VQVRLGPVPYPESECGNPNWTDPVSDGLYRLHPPRYDIGLRIPVCADCPLSPWTFSGIFVVLGFQGPSLFVNHWTKGSRPKPPMRFSTLESSCCILAMLESPIDMSQIQIMGNVDPNPRLRMPIDWAIFLSCLSQFPRALVGTDVLFSLYIFVLEAFRLIFCYNLGYDSRLNVRRSTTRKETA